MRLESLSGTSCDIFQLDGGLEKAIFASLATPVGQHKEKGCKSRSMTIYFYVWKEKGRHQGVSLSLPLTAGVVAAVDANVAIFTKIGPP
jgi:hypothetical protein